MHTLLGSETDRTPARRGIDARVRARSRVVLNRGVLRAAVAAAMMIATRLPSVGAARFRPANRAELKAQVDLCVDADPTGQSTTAAACVAGCVGSTCDGMADWDVSLVTDMNNMFYGMSSFNADIGRWDVSSVTNMRSMFQYAEAFDRDIGEWDVSSVTMMSSMFYNSNAAAFNQSIGGWDVSSVTNMEFMFRGASAFDQDIGGWDVSSVIYMWAMFSHAAAFNQDIGGWDVSSAIDIGAMFSTTAAFNQDIGGWDVSSVTNMGYMFQDASAFNQDIGGWDVSSVESMGRVFNGAAAFNHDIGRWDVSSVRDMYSMFQYATAFNQDIGGWDVSSVESMDYMFRGASAFNHSLECWDDVAMASSSSVFSSAAAFLATFERTDGTSSTDGPPSAWTSKSPNTASCCGVSAPANGAMGACGSALAHGDSCVPTCDAGYVLSGSRSCDDGQLADTAACELPFAPTSRAELKAQVDACIDVDPTGQSTEGACEGGMATWDVSQVTNMSSLFLHHFFGGTKDFNFFNADISRWDVSSVTDMREMFSYASAFNQDIGGWDVSSVTDMRGMFMYTAAFNHSLECWNDGAVTESSSMFYRATAFLAAFTGHSTSDGPPSAWTSTTPNTAPCCGVSAPSNGAMGTCRSALAHGDSCVPTCDAGSVLSGTRSCNDGQLADTVTCTVTVCDANHHVVSNACVACVGGSTRAAGDDATGPDTECAAPAETPGDSANVAAPPPPQPSNVLGAFPPPAPPTPPRVLVADDDESSARTRGSDRAAFVAAAVTAAFAILATAR